MTYYPYVPAVAFKQATRYDYAQCSDAAFISKWQRARADFELRLCNVRSCVPMEMQQHSAIDFIGCLDIIRSCPDEVANDGFWNLVRKFEVFGRLFDGYTSQGRRHSLASPASVDIYIVFAQKLFALTRETEILQFLSTGMKVMDSLSGLSTSLLNVALSREIVDLIACERQLVSDLMRDLH
ncbi:hypothetical protein [Owenweeksia hongkongensis]|uniref:hypothetical protein n=1 Tax=Owenweeksia hongkongensis TaxID=253245 RepID=UPI003A9506EF